MTDAGEAFGQDMLEPAPDELVGMQFHDGGLACGAGGPVEEDVPLFVITDETLGGEGAALDVAGEVAQCRATAASVLELDVPGFGRRKDVALLGC